MHIVKELLSVVKSADNSYLEKVTSIPEGLAQPTLRQL
jgi:hypothetical protein